TSSVPVRLTLMALLPGIHEGMLFEYVEQPASAASTTTRDSFAISFFMVFLLDERNTWTYRIFPCPASPHLLLYRGSGSSISRGFGPARPACASSPTSAPTLSRSSPPRGSTPTSPWAGRAWARTCRTCTATSGR